MRNIINNTLDMSKQQYQLLFVIQHDNGRPMSYYSEKMLISKPNLVITSYSIHYTKLYDIGPESTSKSLRKIAQFFGDQELIDKVEQVIAEEMDKLIPVRDAIRERCLGKTAMLFVGGSRAHHYQELFNSIVV